MNLKTTGRADCNQATPKTSICAFYFTALTARIKALIVTLALWGWLPVPLAYWITNRGEARDE